MKSIKIVIILSLIFSTTFAQRGSSNKRSSSRNSYSDNSGKFSTVIGVTISFTDTKKDFIAIGPTGNQQLFSFVTQGVGYNALIMPKYHFFPKDLSEGAFDVSVGAPLNIGANFNNLGGFIFFYSLGAMADINVGSFRADKQSQYAGAFAGLGFGVTNTNNLGLLQDLQQENIPIPSGTKAYNSAQDFETNFKLRGLSIGPIVHAGFQLGANSKFGIRGSYQLGLNTFGKDYYGFTIIYGGGFMNQSFGMF
jgi:hypothetical protein